VPATSSAWRAMSCGSSLGLIGKRMGARAAGPASERAGALPVRRFGGLPS
jgi:hypothetical protein